ncbi:hypothetical protein CBR56_25320 [Bacillus thuringiensis]|uniref:hypothetical protein n=1 Tax=Bacillus cereus group TaxID=86661 RepID=UPI000B449353|nr:MULTISPECIES: hypothetical protein [Bacillus cereus group]MED3036056.1 hypothetical protein [Bacillus tropicus]OTX90040.1 hypothetical protein BK728_03220 [Bacillus thuringiensis serovar chanpaisis]PNK23966.1 hypothetical protein CBR56_25320 [Bacillus thuringiensis]
MATLSPNLRKFYRQQSMLKTLYKQRVISEEDFLRHREQALIQSKIEVEEREFPYMPSLKHKNKTGF